jgi:hypothetical protein
MLSSSDLSLSIEGLLIDELYFSPNKAFGSFLLDIVSPCTEEWWVDASS